jgi:hypothetical protein
MERNREIEDKVQKHFKDSWRSLNKQINTNISTMVASSFYCDYQGIRLIGHVFYSKDVGLMFMPLDYPYYFTGLIRGNEMVFTWQEGKDYIITAIPCKNELA